MSAAARRRGATERGRRPACRPASRRAGPWGGAAGVACAALVALASGTSSACGARSEGGARCAERAAPTVDVAWTAAPSALDVVLVVDVTGSMREELDALAADADALAAEVLALAPVTQATVFAVSDLSGAGGFGAPRLGLRETASRATAAAAVAEGLAALPALLDDGGDPPEAQLLAVWHAVAPGPRPGSGAVCPPGQSGWASCYADDVPRLVAVVTDAPFHHGPDDSAPYRPPVAWGSVDFGWDLVVGRAQALRARVVGAYTRGEHGGRDVTALVEASGALGLDGRPLSREAAEPAGIAEALREVLTRWRSEVPYDVGVSARVVEGEREVLRGFRLVEVVPPPGALPPTGQTDERAWRVAPGSVVRVTVDVDRAAVPVGRTAVIELAFHDDGKLRLGTQRVPVSRALAARPGACPDGGSDGG